MHYSAQKNSELIFFYKNTDVSQNLKKCQVFVLEDCFFQKLSDIGTKCQSSQIFIRYEKVLATLLVQEPDGVKMNHFLNFFQRLKKHI